VAVDASGNLYIADYDNRVIEKVTPAGVLSVINVGVGFGGITLPVSDPLLWRPTGVAVDMLGNVYVAESDTYHTDNVGVSSPGAGVVLKITPSGVLSVVAGNCTSGAPVSGAATSSPLGIVDGIAVDSLGNLFIADYNNSVIAKVTPAGSLSLAAGTAKAPLDAQIIGVAVDSSGNLYFVSLQTNKVEKVTPAGIVTSAALGGVPAENSALGVPWGLAVNASGSPFIGVGRSVVKVTGGLT